MQGHQVTQQYLEKHGFQYPIAVAKLDGLGLQLPLPSFSVKDVEQYVGESRVCPSYLPLPTECQRIPTTITISGSVYRRTLAPLMLCK